MKYISHRVNRDSHFHPVISIMRIIAPQIVTNPGSPARDADNAQVARGLRLENAGCFQTVAAGGRGMNQFNQAVKLRA